MKEKLKRREKHPKKQNEMKLNWRNERLHQQRKLQATSVAYVKLDPAGQERNHLVNYYNLYRQVHLSVDCRVGTLRKRAGANHVTALFSRQNRI